MNIHKKKIRKNLVIKKKVVLLQSQNGRREAKGRGGVREGKRNDL